MICIYIYICVCSDYCNCWTEASDRFPDYHNDQGIEDECLLVIRHGNGTTLFDIDDCPIKTIIFKGCFSIFSQLAMFDEG